MRIVTILLVAALGASVPALASSPSLVSLGLDPPPDRLAIEAVAMDYLTSGLTGDVERLRNAFHPCCRLQFVKGGEYIQWSGNDYVKWREPGKTSDYEAQVLGIDQAGTAAMAKVELDYGTHRFVDYLSLLKVDGRWWIVNKVFYRAG